VQKRLKSKRPATVGVVVSRGNAFQMNESGSVVGPIYWRVGNGFFPSKDWEDFPVPILAWWLAACKKHIDRATRQKLNFMDGPYEIRLSAASATTSELAFCHLGLRVTEVLMTVRVRKTMLRKTLIAAAETILTACKRLSMTSEDVDDLERELKKLQPAAAPRPSKSKLRHARLS